MTKNEFVEAFKAEGGSEGYADGEVVGFSTLEKRGFYIVGRKEQEVCVSFEVYGKYKYIADVLN